MLQNDRQLAQKQNQADDLQLSIDEQPEKPYSNCFDDKTDEVQQQIAQRMQAMRDSIINFDDFPWHCHTEIIKGVTLKHVVDHFFSRAPI